ncbi:MAG: class I SAM-dependent methyltransferase [Bdellovibrionales bacterium]
MALIGVEALSEEFGERAAEWARQWGVPVWIESRSPRVPGPGVKVVVGELGLGLAFAEAHRAKPYYVDFLTGRWRARIKQGLGRSHPLRRALGSREGALHVIDATAGFGQDSLTLAFMGCEVTALERSPVVAALLKDGLDRAYGESVELREVLGRIQVVQAEALAYLPKIAAREGPARPDVIYMDPMFVKPKTSAKSPKEMQLLQELLGSPAVDEDLRLLEVGLETARARVVVKRPLKGKAVRPGPVHSYKGQSIRYDVYLRPRES